MTHDDAAYVVDFEIQDNPTEAYIQDLRSRFPVEREVDAMLTRKMRRRSGPPYHRLTLNEMKKHLENFLSHELSGTDFAVTDVRWFTGGVSKIQVGFTLDWESPERGRRVDRMVVRMDPSEGSNATSRAREFELIRLVDGTVPVPETFFLDAEGAWFPEPALIYAFADGVTKPRSTTTGRISGLGTNFGPEFRAKLAPQYLEHLAKIHTIDVAGRKFASLDVPAVGTTQAAEWMLNQTMRTWEEDRGEDLPLIEVAANWLQRNLPTLDTVSVVHGDYRSGNFLFDEDSGRINAWLDWERGLIGDRHRDLAWITQLTMGHYDESGRYYVCGLVPEEEFFDRYTEASGLTVDHERLTFYQILNCFMIVVSTLGSAYRVARLGKSHQDIMLTRVEGMVPVISKQLSSLLRENL